MPDWAMQGGWTVCPSVAWALMEPLEENDEDVMRRRNAALSCSSRENVLVISCGRGVMWYEAGDATDWVLGGGRKRKRMWGGGAAELGGGCADNEGPGCAVQD